MGKLEAMRSMNLMWGVPYAGLDEEVGRQYDPNEDVLYVMEKK